MRGQHNDPYLHRFTQADLIVSALVNPQSLNRFSYAYNSPTIYVDTTGYTPCPDGICETVDDILGYYGIGVSDDYSESEKWAILQGVDNLAYAMLNTYEEGCTAGNTVCETNHTAYTLFNRVMGGIVFERTSDTNSVCRGGAGGVYCGTGAIMTGRFAVHELGHTFDARVNWGGRLAVHDMSIFTSSGEWISGWHNGTWDRGLLGYPGKKPGYRAPYLYHGPAWSDWNQIVDEVGNYTGVGYNEEWADMFLNWSYGSFTNIGGEHDAGTVRSNWMDETVFALLPHPVP